MEPKTDKGPQLVKHNFRTAEKNGFKTEVWTLGRETVSGPVSPGYRVCLPDDAKDAPPQTSARFVLRKKDTKEMVCEATLEPTLKKSAIDGGYLETIEVQPGQFEERDKEKFVGAKRIWEINVKDPFKLITPNGSTLAPGHYLLSVEISIKDGPSFQFNELTFRRFVSRSPADMKD
jgi:hypothetical protein